MAKVSIVVPVYNVEKYIERCIHSLTIQTEKDIEIIIVDDCSPDNSISKIENYLIHDSRIKVLKHQENKGLMWARKTGYMAATGDYVTFCDSDDYLPENAVELLYNEAIKTSADIVSGNMIELLVNGACVEWTSKLIHGNDKKAALKSLLLGELKHNLCSKLFRRSLLQDFNYQTFEHFTNGEDACLFYQVIRNIQKIVQIDAIVYNYLQNIVSSSQVRYNNNALLSICKVNHIRHEVTKSYPELDVLRHRFITRIIYSLYYRGYGTSLKNYINEQGLEKYLSLKGNYFTCKEKCILRLKRYVLGPINGIKSRIH